MALTLIGAGLGRTGTLSIKIAVEKLKRSRCYHMAEVFVNPDHIDHWLKAARGDEIDWDAMFENYTACVDWPACYFWDVLTEHYPDAKVLLSVRDPESWYHSVKNTIYISMTQPITDNPLLMKQARMARQIVLQQHFDGRFEDKNFAIDLFTQHIETIKRKVPADRLLIFDACEGWAPLCQFLCVPVPEEPFPNVNTTDQYRSIFFTKN